MARKTDREILEENESKRQPVECWTRVMGYFRPFSQFNKGKKSEFKDRKWFTEENADAHMAQEDDNDKEVA